MESHNVVWLNVSPLQSTTPSYAQMRPAQHFFLAISSLSFFILFFFFFFFFFGVISFVNIMRIIIYGSLVNNLIFKGQIKLSHLFKPFLCHKKKLKL